MCYYNRTSCPQQHVTAPLNLQQLTGPGDVPADAPAQEGKRSLELPELILCPNVFPSPELKGEIFIKEYMK